MFWEFKRKIKFYKLKRNIKKNKNSVFMRSKVFQAWLWKERRKKFLEF